VDAGAGAGAGVLVGDAGAMPEAVPIGPRSCGGCGGSGPRAGVSSRALGLAIIFAVAAVARRRKRGSA
jgi:hypothetical protein